MFVTFHVEGQLELLRPLSLRISHFVDFSCQYVKLVVGGLPFVGGLREVARVDACSLQFCIGAVGRFSHVGR